MAFLHAATTSTCGFNFNTFNVFKPNFFCIEFQYKVRFAYKNFTLIKIKFTHNLVGLNKKEKCNKAPKNGKSGNKPVRKKISPHQPYPTHEYEKKSERNKKEEEKKGEKE